ncbi:hypothetical protein BM1_00558 [Bipolaris maydis]|nr:hypothetical protein BM1_00558 [Bipolaris maydis]
MARPHSEAQVKLSRIAKNTASAIAGEESPKSSLGLHPPIQAQAPALDQDVAVRNQPNIARPPASALWKMCAHPRCARREVVHMQAYAPRNRNNHQSALDQQIPSLSLPNHLYCRETQDYLKEAPGLVLRFEDGSSAKAPLRRLSVEAPR